MSASRESRALYESMTTSPNWPLIQCFGTVNLIVGAFAWVGGVIAVVVEANTPYQSPSPASFSWISTGWWGMVAGCVIVLLVEVADSMTSLNSKVPQRQQ